MIKFSNLAKCYRDKKGKSINYSFLKVLIISFFFFNPLFLMAGNGDQYAETSLTYKSSEVQNGDDIHFNEIYTITYTWKIIPDGEFKKGDRLDFSIPKEFKVVSPVNEFGINSASTGQEIARAKVVGNEVQMTFTADVDNQINVAGKIVLQTQINKTYVKEGQQITVTFPNLTLNLGQGHVECVEGSCGSGEGGEATNKYIKRGSIQATDEGMKLVEWRVTLGIDIILAKNTACGKPITIDDVESVTLTDTPKAQKFVSTIDQKQTIWGRNKAWFDGESMKFSFLRSQSAVGISGDAIKYEFLPYIKQQDAAAKSKNARLRAVALEYFTVPDDTSEAGLKKLSNDVTITIKYKAVKCTTQELTLTDEVEWTEGGGEADGEEVDVTGSGTKDLEVIIKWMVQPDKYRPAMEQDCKKYKSMVHVFENDGNEIGNEELDCGKTFEGLKPVLDADQENPIKPSKGFKQRSKTIIRGTKKDLILFINQKCADGQDPSGKNEACEVEELPPYIGVPGVVNPTFPTGPNPPAPVKPTDPDIPTDPGSKVPPTTGTPGEPGTGGPGGPGTGGPGDPDYPNTGNPGTPGGETPGNPGPEPSNPIFVPPLVENEIPTQVSKKPFKPIFVDPNLKVRPCQGEFCKGTIYPPFPEEGTDVEVPGGEKPGGTDPENPDPGNPDPGNPDPEGPDPVDPSVPKPVEYEYEVEYCDPYGDGCEILPLENEKAFKKWIGGKFYVYLLDAMVNPDYLKKCQKQATVAGDLEELTSLPYYFTGADLSLSGNKGKKLTNHAPYKSYEIDMKINPSGGYPFFQMDGVSIPDAHQKLSFMVKFIPLPENKYVSEYNICNIDTFALRPAAFVTKTSNFQKNDDVNNLSVDKKSFFENKARVTSSFSYNEDIHTKIFYPIDFKESSSSELYGVPNYQIGLGFYKENPPTGKGGVDLAKSTLITTSQDVVKATLNGSKAVEPYIKGVTETCKFKAEDICGNGLCSGDASVASRSMDSQATTSSSRSRARRAAGRNTAQAKAPAKKTNSGNITGNNGGSNLLWTDGPMLIETIFAYFNNGDYIGQDSAHSKIKKIREKLAYYGSGKPTSRYDQDENGKKYENRSLVSTHNFNGKRIFTYNNVGDMQIVIVDNKWTIYDQDKKDVMGRTRAEKCILNSGSNNVSNGLVGCDVDMENKEVVATYVPEFIELNPVRVEDKFHSEGKDFTYFANKVGKGNMEDMDDEEKAKQMYATYELDATAYVSKEIYGTPLTREFGYLDHKYSKELPLIAYGYENQYGTSTGCGRDVDFLFTFDFACESKTFNDIKIADKITKRCAPTMSEKRTECANFPLDSRCHSGINNEKDKNFENHDMKEKFNIFNTDDNQTVYDSKKKKTGYNIELKDFKNGTATKGHIMYFNFERSVNYPTNPKLVNINDFNGTKIVQHNFKKNDKTFIPGEDANKTQPKNTYSKVPDEKAFKHNAHFYYGYVNSTSRDYYICAKASSTCPDTNNPVDVNIMTYNKMPGCSKYPQSCEDSLLVTPEDPTLYKDLYVTDRKMYRNKYNNYTSQFPEDDPENINFFAKSYISQIYKIKPTYRSEETKDGREKLKFSNIPENFPEDLVNVTTSPWFVYSDGRGKINEKTPFNIFRLISYEKNTWGGEGSVKYQYEASESGNNNEDFYDSVGSVPLGKDLKGAAVSTNRRLRY